MASQKNVLIGGITGSIGNETAKKLHSSGWQVIGFARGELHSDQPKDFEVIAADARNSESVDQAFEDALAKLGHLDAYVHAIGSIRLKPFHNITNEEWEDTIDRNLTSAFYATRAALRIMNKQGSGSIVLLSSAAAVVGLPSHEAVAAAKGGINGLVLSAAASYASRGIRVNAVAPGLVETNLSRPVISSEQARAISERMHPLGRIGQPMEIASLIAWLCSDDASWVSGQIWSIDGGMAHLNQRPRA
ncbi:MAG: SDR family NAD(P)-dependent oxidoreductase [Puniceicoccaceae bacterium]